MIVPALAGPTACGKSALALRLAERQNGEIVSVDSGAVYRDMNIGTATPTTAMRDRVCHHLLDIVAPTEGYHVGRFVADARAAVADILARGKTPILVGGAMMYFHALRCGLSPMPPPPLAIARATSAEMRARGAPAMHAILAAVDPPSAATIAPFDRQRVHRALCMYRATGKPFSAWRQSPAQSAMPLRLLRLTPTNREELNRRIESRLVGMWADGLEAETRHLLERWRLSPESPPMRMAGYRQAAARLRGEGDDKAMRLAAAQATRQLAKRQMTWLRRWTDAPIIDPLRADAADKAEALLARVDSRQA